MLTRTKPPTWFTVVAVMLVLWGAMGCWAFYQHVTIGPAAMGDTSDYGRRFHEARPGWFDADYAMAVGGGLIGAVLLLLGSRWAIAAFTASIIGVVIQFGYIFGGTDLVAERGVGMTVPFPLFILIVAAAQLWLAVRARDRGWIG